MAIKNYYPWTYWKQHVFGLVYKLFGPFKDPSLQVTWIHSTQNTQKPFSPELFDMSIKAIQHAINIDLSDLAVRQNSERKWLEIFPGEHYKLLAALVELLQPKKVVEIGTYLGHASLTIKKYLPQNGALYTFDVFKWDQFEDSCFVETDFDNQLFQICEDLTDYSMVIKNKELLQDADFIFVDALKDGVQEKKFMKNFKELGLKENAILFFDDIRVWNMIKIWNDIDMPKVDLTSFGHWSGSGLVQWKN